MQLDGTLLVVASRQVRAVLHRWDPQSSPAAGTSPLEDLVTPILAALTFEPTVAEFAVELGDLVAARLRVRPTRAECLAAARDLIDQHRLLFDAVIDAA